MRPHGLPVGHLVQLGDALAALIRRSQGRDNKTLADFAESLRKILEKFKF